MLHTDDDTLRALYLRFFSPNILVWSCFCAAVSLPILTNTPYANANLKGHCLQTESSLSVHTLPMRRKFFTCADYSTNAEKKITDNSNCPIICLYWEKTATKKIQITLNSTTNLWREHWYLYQFGNGFMNVGVSTLLFLRNTVCVTKRIF